MKYQIGQQIDPAMLEQMMGAAQQQQVQQQVPMDMSPENMDKSYAEQFEIIESKYDSRINELKKKAEKLQERMNEDPTNKMIQNQLRRIQDKIQELEEKKNQEIEYLMAQVEQTGAMAEEDPQSAMHNKMGNLEGYANSEEMPMMQSGGITDWIDNPYPLSIFEAIDGDVSLPSTKIDTSAFKINPEYKASTLTSDMVKTNIDDTPFEEQMEILAKKEEPHWYDTLKDRPVSDYLQIAGDIADTFLGNIGDIANREAEKMIYSDNPYIKLLDESARRRNEAENEISNRYDQMLQQVRNERNRMVDSNDARSLGQRFALQNAADIKMSEAIDKINSAREQELSRTRQQAGQEYNNIFDRYAQTRLENQQLNYAQRTNAMNKAVEQNMRRQIAGKNLLNDISRITQDERDLKYHYLNMYSREKVMRNKSLFDNISKSLFGVTYDDLDDSKKAKVHKKVSESNNDIN